MKVCFIYKSTFGDEQKYIFDYGEKENFYEQYYYMEYADAYKLMENEINSMVDDYEELLSWEIEE